MNATIRTDTEQGLSTVNLNHQLLALTLLHAVAGAHAGEWQAIKDPAEISKILADIPVVDKEMNYKNIGERLNNVGMPVSLIRTYTIDKKNELETPTDRIGDKHFLIVTKDPSTVLKDNYCNMLGSPSFLKRGKKYYPQDRTGVWLTTSKCELPK
jgi:hypothetical protein